MPAGEEYFIGGKRQNFPHQVNQHQYRSEIHKYNSLNDNTEEKQMRDLYSNKYYDRSLGIKDIEGTQTGTLISKVVKNKDLAHRYADQYMNQQYNQDSLDHFLSNSQQKFIGRQHYFNDNQNENQDNKRMKDMENIYDNDAYYNNRQPQQQNQRDQIQERDYQQQSQRQQYESQEQEKKMMPQDYVKEQDRQLQDKQNYEQRLQLYLEEEIKQKKLAELEREIEELKHLQQQEEQEQQMRQYEQYQKYQRNNNQVQKPEQNNSQNISVVDQQREKAQDNMQKLQENQLELEKQQIQERLYKQQQQLEGNSTDLICKLDLNGFPVYQKKPRMNPNNFSFTGEELRGQQRIGYNILGNKIVEQKPQAGEKANLLERENLDYQLKVKQFEKYPGELDIKNQEMERQLDNYYNDIRKDHGNQEQKYKELQALRQKEQQQKYEQALSGQQRIQYGYEKEKYKNQMEIDKLQLQDRIDDSQQQNKYTSEYVHHYKPEFQKSKPFGPFEHNFSREVYHPREHSKLNALGTIPNEPHNKVETTKEIIRRPSGEMIRNENAQQNTNRQQDNGNSRSLRDSQYRFPNKDQDRQNRIQELQKQIEQQKFEHQQLAGVSTNYGPSPKGVLDREPYGYNNLQGSLLLDKTNHGGKMLKNLSNVRIY